MRRASDRERGNSLRCTASRDLKSPVMKLMFPRLIFAGMVAFLSSSALAQTPPEILLKDYKPVSIFKIPQTTVEKARHPVIDVHSHDYAPTPADVDRWVRTMDAVGLEKTVILAGNTGDRFEAAVRKYGQHPKRFSVWCGIDFRGLNEAGFGPAALVELERCRQAGAEGVGELSDKGRGLGATSNALGIHIDDPRMDPILEKCAQLRMPVNIHVGEDQWMYEPMDATNDGLMNAWKWQITNAPGVLSHRAVLETLERAVEKHPRTVFIACHLANCCADLNRLGAMLDKYPNLHADIGARFGELSPIPRTVSQFFQRYQDRILYGTDMNPEAGMYRVSFQLLETADEHFYAAYFRKYHWPMHAWALPDEVLRKVYRENALRILGR